MHSSLKTYVIVSDDNIEVITLGVDTSKSLDVTVAEQNFLLGAEKINVAELIAAGQNDYGIRDGQVKEHYSLTCYEDYIARTEMFTKNPAYAMHYLAAWQYPVHVVTRDAYNQAEFDVTNRVHYAQRIAGEVREMRSRQEVTQDAE